MTKVRCQQCGKTSQYSASDAGLTALCVACGNRFTIPVQADEGLIPDSELKDADGLESLALVVASADPAPIDSSAAPPAHSSPTPSLVAQETAQSPQAPPGYVIASPTPPGEVNYALLYTLLVSAITAAIVLVAVVIFNAKPTGEVRNKSKVQYTAGAPATTQSVAVVTTTPSTLPNEEAIAHNWPEYAPKAIATRPAIEKPVQKPPAVVVVVPMPVAPQVVKTPAPGLVRPAINIQRRADGGTDGLTDEAIGQAIQRAVNNLIAQFQNGKLHGGGNRNDAYQTGLDALCVYALLQSSYAIKDERLNPKGLFIRDLIGKMKAMPADNGPATYARGIRATALALLNRPEDKPALQQDVSYLLNSQIDGAYTYQARRGGYPGGMRGFGWDNSNSQYGLLGVWSGAEVGIEVNNTYWAAVENHWTRCQLQDGSWDYGGFGRGGNGRLSMSLAGCASLFVTHDWLDAPKIGAQVGREPFSKALAKGLAYLETGDHSLNINGGYTLYGLERVGLASGFKFFGNHEWYRELARISIRDQEMDGGWGDEIETAYHLLFLARGRHPVLMNKLRYDGYWANRPRDVANLARFGAKELERPLNWQVVPITRDWTDWMDSPILYIASHAAAKFSDEEIKKIRSFVQAGGLLFTQADASQSEADEWAQDLAKKLFPLYEMKDLNDQHEIFNILYKPSPHPKLRGVSNGARLFMVHAPTDITQHWQMRQEKSRRGMFELGINLFLYAAGKGDLRNRISSPYIPPQGTAGGGSVKIVRLKYAGNWDPEPMAWTRFSRYFQRATDVGVDVSSIEMDQLSPELAGFAHWTGTDAYTATSAEIAAIRKFVEAGGVLLIDPCGGSSEFFESARSALLKAFPETRAQFLSKTHPLLSASGPGMDDLALPQVRPYTKARGISVNGRIDCVNFGKGKVLLSPFDLTTGLTGCNTWGILGYDPGYASSLVKNMLVWSATGMKEE